MHSRTCLPKPTHAKPPCYLLSCSYIDFLGFAWNMVLVAISVFIFFTGAYMDHKHRGRYFKRSEEELQEVLLHKDSTDEILRIVAAALNGKAASPFNGSDLRAKIIDQTSRNSLTNSHSQLLPPGYPPAPTSTNSNSQLMAPVPIPVPMSASGTLPAPMAQRASPPAQPANTVVGSALSRAADRSNRKDQEVVWIK
jgi:hypothetical protein